MTLKRSDPLYDPKRRIVRAKKHLVNLDRRIKRFLFDKPYTFVVEPDTDGTHELHIIEFTRRLSPECDDLAFEALFTIRAAFDQAGYAAAVASGIKRPKNSYFPIADTPAELENLIKGRCRDLPREIVTLFRSFHPYKGGNDAIWALNKLRHAAHTALTPIGVAGANIVVSHWGNSSALEGMDLTWDRVKNRIVFARGELGTQWNYQVRPSFVIGFDEVQITGRNAAINVLDAAFGEAVKVVQATERRCRDLGIIK